MAAKPIERYVKKQIADQGGWPRILERIASGETFIVETEDSRTGRTRTPETTTPEFLRAMRAKGYHGNPVTGPIYIEGAEPGDALAVRIHDMKSDTLGYLGYWPFLYHLDDWITDPVTELVEIRDGQVRCAFHARSGTHNLRSPNRRRVSPARCDVHSN